MDTAIERGKDSIGASAPWLASEGAWSSRCRTTRWSVVLAAASEGEAARRALSILYRAYWRPLYAFVARRRGHQAAAELTQRFFAERLLAAGDLRGVERRPGQLFRGWLFTALRRFLIRQSRSERCQCRDVTKTVAWAGDQSSDGAGALVLKAVDHDAERQLQRARTLSLLGEVIARLRQEYEAHAETSGVDGAVRFEALKVFLPGPNAEIADYAECSAALGMKASTMKQVVKRLRVRFAELLVARVRQDVSSDSEVPQALKDLCAALELPATYPEVA
jgi:DNA-directed RNA polymerase specialized sigma24 family protein